MAILTKPSSIAKGVPASFSIDKAQLAAHPIVAADSHFSNSAKWSKITIKYKNAQGQKKTVTFSASESTPAAQFLASLKARGDFEVQTVDIFDEDGGKLRIKRSDLTASEWDASLDESEETLPAFLLDENGVDAIIQENGSHVLL